VPRRFRANGFTEGSDQRPRCCGPGSRCSQDSLLRLGPFFAEDRPAAYHKSVRPASHLPLIGRPVEGPDPSGRGLPESADILIHRGSFVHAEFQFPNYIHCVIFFSHFGTSVHLPQLSISQLLLRSNRFPLTARHLARTRLALRGSQAQTKIFPGELIRGFNTWPGISRTISPESCENRYHFQ
jgi:hypothetical protein